MDGETRMVAEMKIVRASDQRLITIDLHGRRGGQLMATAAGGLQSPAVCGPLVDDIATWRGRIGATINRQ